MNANRKGGEIHFAAGHFTFWITIILVQLVLVPNIGIGQTPLPGEIMKAVSFLFPTDGKTVRMGTGFYVTIGTDKSPPYLVTSKHVLMRESSKDYYPVLCMKVNNNKGGTDHIPIDLSRPNGARVFVDNNDPAVDIAVIPGNDIRLPPGRTLKDYDFTSFPSSGFATKEHFAKRDIAVGDEAFFTGWFSAFYGTFQNYPIVRFGRLAMATDEKIPWGGEAQMLNLYLVEAHATKGNSGSPVFFRPNIALRTPGALVVGTSPVYLAGVLKGYFSALESPNAGIAAVVPAFQLQQILLSDEVTRERSAAGKGIPPTPESIEQCLQAEKTVRGFLGQP